MDFKTLATKKIQKILAQKGLSIKRIEEPAAFAFGYISAKDTISAADDEGLPVCEYVERLWALEGNTQKVIDNMAACGAFNFIKPNIVEIGTGTGRYLEKVLQKSRPAKYESYETARDWAEWLESKYPIISHEVDGISLRKTPHHSADLVHAHGLFVYLPFLISYRYWKEIWRVVKEGGIVVFDIISEDCLDEAIVEKWLNSKCTYPCFLSEGFVVSLFRKNGFSLLSTFKNRYGEGVSEYLVFTRSKFDQ
jgi:SAM-dependent methyltransferase